MLNIKIMNSKGETKKMKKVLIFLMAAVMMVSFAACAKTPADEENTTDADAQIENSVEETSEAAAATGDTVAQALVAEFKALAASETDAQAIADKLAASAAVAQIGPATMPVEAGLLTGFDNVEITDFESGVMFAPMIGTIPFVGYVFTLADGADVAAFVKTLEDNANLRWNICTEADEMVAVAEGNVVFFVMAPASLDA